MRRVLSAAVVVAMLAVAPAALGWTWPVQGSVLRPYSFTAGTDPYAAGKHRGIDVAAAPGTEVRAPTAGTVSFAGSLPQGGRALTIQTADGYSVTLLQLAETLVERGAAVAEGDVVARSGTSADPLMTEPHVHLGVRLTAAEDGYVDPLGLLPPPPAEPSPPASEPDDGAAAPVAAAAVPAPVAAVAATPAAEPAAPVASSPPAPLASSAAPPPELLQVARAPGRAPSWSRLPRPRRSSRTSAPARRRRPTRHRSSRRRRRAAGALGCPRMEPGVSAPSSGRHGPAPAGRPSRVAPRGCSRRSYRCGQRRRRRSTGRATNGRLVPNLRARHGRCRLLRPQWRRDLGT
jgi:hypothetical protein